MNLNDLNIDNTWTLFLDRDGVINRRIENSYIRKPEEFIFIPGVLEALKMINPFFGWIFIVTNQQGIGKGLMTEEILTLIHENMSEEIIKHGGRIDKIYYCPDREEEKTFNRKPLPGMALKARKEFPGVIFKKSIMAGDSLIDMQFGKHLGMKTVLIGDDNNIAREHPKFVDFYLPDLLTFSSLVSVK